MTATINYDKHVENLIDELSHTGHVTHSKHKKTSVTFHHNGGLKLSHHDILNIWKTRPASAAFDVDVHGKVAEYVRPDEYAWAVGNTQGNETTISIEMANLTVAPHWKVAEVTWKEAARLAGWLFVHEIKAEPTRHNVFPHQHWSATGCPGPYVMRIFDQILEEVQKSYHHFKNHPHQ
jgi:N-acetyl-anhydromuramyl-L-alanine amidase AmpD